MSGTLNVLLATLEPGDEVLMTDPTYCGFINRVRLAGGVPRFVQLIPSTTGWRLDLEALASIDPKPVRVALLMSPSMPTGAVFSFEEWRALVTFCQAADCWVINSAAMERILFDGRSVIHPASFPGMRDKVITVGSASKEYRMIGWRVGWVVGPAHIVADVARVGIANVVSPPGIAMGAVAMAIRSGTMVSRVRRNGRPAAMCCSPSCASFSDPAAWWMVIRHSMCRRWHRRRGCRRRLSKGEEGDGHAALGDGT
jgi:aspartate/methionine/tyrosine aminotransferase